MLSSNISSTCRHNMVNFGLLAAEIRWRVWGTPANFNRFHVLASLLHGRCSTEVNKTLQDVWLSPGLLHCIYNSGGSCPIMVFCQVQYSLCVQVVHFPVLAALLHDTRPTAISQTLWHGARIGIMELSQSAPTIFGSAAVTLGIGPHSSVFYCICMLKLVAQMVSPKRLRHVTETSYLCYPNVCHPTGLSPVVCHPNGLLPKHLGAVQLVSD